VRRGGVKLAITLLDEEIREVMLGTALAEVGECESGLGR
jgi:hypothetical protein